VQLLENTGKNTWLEVSIHEGKNRQIHRTAEALGFNVLKLTRVAYGGLTVDDSARRRDAPSAPEEIEKLRRAVGGSKHTFQKVRKRAPSQQQNRRRRRGR